MLIYEAKLGGTRDQYERLDGAIRTGRFVRNFIIRAWVSGEPTALNPFTFSKIEVVDVEIN